MTISQVVFGLKKLIHISKQFDFPDPEALEVEADGEIKRVFEDGSIVWTKDGHRHRGFDLPAFISSDGSKYWYKNGCISRDCGPAVILFTGEQIFYKNGKII